MICLHLQINAVTIFIPVGGLTVKSDIHVNIIYIIYYALQYTSHEYQNGWHIRGASRKHFYWSDWPKLCKIQNFQKGVSNSMLMRMATLCHGGIIINTMLFYNVILWCIMVSFAVKHTIIPENLKIHPFIPFKYNTV